MKTEDSNSVSKTCMVYGLPVFAASFLVFLYFTFYGLEHTLLDVLVFYLTSSALVSVMVFIARLRSGNSFPDINELGIAFVSGSGFALPVVLVGLLTAGISFGGRTDSNDSYRKLPEAVLQRVSSELGLSEDTFLYAMELLEEMLDSKILPGRPVSDKVSAVVYIASRETGEPRTMSEISKVTRSSIKDVGRAYRDAGRAMDVRIIPPNPSEFVKRFCGELKLSKDVENRAKRLIEEAEAKGLTSGKSPRGIAASAIYLASYSEGEKRTMKDVSDTLGVTTITIRERSRELIKNLGIDNYPGHFDNSI